MKIKSEHLNHIVKAISAIPVETRAAHYETLKTDTRVNNIDKRFRWDCFRAAGLTSFACDTLYTYLDDTHIDSALKAVIKDVQP